MSDDQRQERNVPTDDRNRAQAREWLENLGFVMEDEQQSEATNATSEPNERKPAA
jgi:hypothetical protein